MKQPERQVVKAILANLNGRSGFDHWWDGIDDDIQKEIARDLEGVVIDVMNLAGPKWIEDGIETLLCALPGDADPGDLHIGFQDDMDLVELNQGDFSCYGDSLRGVLQQALDNRSRIFGTL